MFAEENSTSGKKYIVNTGHNYSAYRHQTLGHAYVTGASDIITGVELCPAPLAVGAAVPQAAVDARAAEIREWTARNRKMYEYFLYTQSPSVVGHFIDIDHGDCVAWWTAIQRMYLTGTRAGALSTIYAVNHMRQTTTTIAFVHDIKEKYRELTNIQTAVDQLIQRNAAAAAVALAAGLPAPVPAHVSTMAHLLAISALLRGLPNDFAILVEQLSRTADLTLDQAVQYVLEKAEMLQHERSTSATAYSATTSGPIEPKITIGLKATCTYCGKKNHTEAQCYSKFPEKKDERAKAQEGKFYAKAATDNTGFDDDEFFAVP